MKLEKLFSIEQSNQEISLNRFTEERKPGEQSFSVSISDTDGVKSFHFDSVEEMKVVVGMLNREVQNAADSFGE